MLGGESGVVAAHAHALCARSFLAALTHYLLYLDRVARLPRSLAQPEIQFSGAKLDMKFMDVERDGCWE